MRINVPTVRAVLLPDEWPQEEVSPPLPEVCKHGVLWGGPPYCLGGGTYDQAHSLEVGEMLILEVRINSILISCVTLGELVRSLNLPEHLIYKQI